jgi:hypothetical protein
MTREYRLWLIEDSFAFDLIGIYRREFGNYAADKKSLSISAFPWLAMLFTSRTEQLSRPTKSGASCTIANI